MQWLVVVAAFWNSLYRCKERKKIVLFANRCTHALNDSVLQKVRLCHRVAWDSKCTTDLRSFLVTSKGLNRAIKPQYLSWLESNEEELWDRIACLRMPTDQACGTSPQIVEWLDWSRPFQRWQSSRGKWDRAINEGQRKSVCSSSWRLLHWSSRFESSAKNGKKKKKNWQNCCWLAFGRRTPTTQRFSSSSLLLHWP